MEESVLCAASAYNKKYYLNESFSGLPDSIKDELKIACVLHTAEVGGTITLYFDEDDGSLCIATNAEEDDILFDEIGAGLKVKQLRKEKAELFESLETYYRVFFLGEEIEEI